MLQPPRSAWKPWHKWLNNGGVRSIPMAPLSDLIDLLGAFDEESVEYLLVGGQDVARHGAPRFSECGAWRVMTMRWRQRPPDSRERAPTTRTTLMRAVS